MIVPERYLISLLVCCSQTEGKRSHVMLLASVDSVFFSFCRFQPVRGTSMMVVSLF